MLKAVQGRIENRRKKGEEEVMENKREGGGKRNKRTSRKGTHTTHRVQLFQEPHD